jgi:hypothetical protein
LGQLVPQHDVIDDDDDGLEYVETPLTVDEYYNVVDQRPPHNNSWTIGLEADKLMTIDTVDVIFILSVICIFLIIVGMVCRYGIYKTA